MFSTTGGGHGQGLASSPVTDTCYLCGTPGADTREHVVLSPTPERCSAAGNGQPPSPEGDEHSLALDAGVRALLAGQDLKSPDDDRHALPDERMPSHLLRL
jgi:hypothetical protein